MEGMSTSDAATPQPATPDDAAAAANGAGGAEAEAATPGTDAVEAAAPEVTETQLQVGLQRSVRYPRVIIGGGLVGLLAATLVSVLFPVSLEADYTLAQITGFMAVIGAAIGLGLGALVALLLGRIAKRQHGSGTAIQADVR